MAKAKFKDSQGNIRSLNNIKINYAKEDDWQPEPDWWDIDKILEEDTEPYDGKIIVLLPDSDVTTTIVRNVLTTNCKKIKTSDDIVYENITSNIIHTWDKSKDKECNLGYKTRYYIMYYDIDSGILSDNTYLNNCIKQALYIIIKNINLVDKNGNHFQNMPFVKCIKMKECKFTPIALRLGGNYSLEKFEGLDTSNIANLSSFLSAFTIYNFFKYYDIDTSNVQNFSGAFHNTRTNYIKSLNLNNANNVSNMFLSADSLITINNISNIKISGLSFTNCANLNHDTLIRILEALYDYSNGDTHTITLGATNITKLTPEELTIGQNKNWTIS